MRVVGVRVKRMKMTSEPVCFHKRVAGLLLCATDFSSSTFAFLSSVMSVESGRTYGYGVKVAMHICVVVIKT